MWYHTYGCAEQYRCASAIYLLSCLALELSIIIYRAVGSPINGKHFVDSLNAIYKQTLKLAMAKLLNPKFIRDYPNIFKFMQVHENKEGQAVI